MATKKLMKSGAQLRAFRRHLASRADRPSEKYTRTLKFPLEDNGFFTNPEDFQAATQLYNITEGIETNSLYGLLMRLHLGGFRLFSSATKAYTFRNSKVFGNDQFTAALQVTFGVEFKKLDVESIYEDLKRARRNTGGKVKSLSGRELAENYYQQATGKKIDTSSEDFDMDSPDFNAGLFEFFRKFGRALEKEFESWSEVNEDISSGSNAAFGFLDELLAEYSVNLPSIKKRLTLLSEPKPNNSTIAFDPSKKITASYPNEIAIHIVVAQYLQDIQKETPTKSAAVKYLQTNITTETHSGLSWLLGAGLKYLSTTDKKIIVNELEITDTKVVSELTDIAQTINPVVFLGDDNYSVYRRTFGGKLDSWIANYASRLYELDETLTGMGIEFCLSESLNDPLAANFLGGTGINISELNTLVTDLYSRKEGARDSLNRLFGIDTKLPEIADVKALEEFSNELDAVSGLLSMLDNRLDQELEHAKTNKDVPQQVFLNDCFFTKPVWLKKLPKLNRISGGVPNYKQELKQSVEDFNTTRQLMQAHFVRIEQFTQDHHMVLDVLGNIANREQLNINRFKAQRPSAPVSETAPIRAYRNLFHRIARVAMSCSPEVKDKVKGLLLGWEVFSPKDMNRLFNNRQGAIYQSLFSKKKHDPYFLNEKALGARPYLDLFYGFITELQVQASQSGFQHYNDLLKLERTYYGLMLGGLPDNLPKALGALDLPEHLMDLSPILKGALSQETLSAETIIKAFNHYHSVLNGLAAKLSRQEFLVRTKFTRVGDTGLVYQPKDKTWSVPERYIITDKEIGSVFKQPPLANLLDDNKLEVRSALESLSTTYKSDWGKRAKNGALTPYLRQSPHDWKYTLGYGNSSNINEPGFKCDKAAPRQYADSHKGLVRLIGPSSFKEWLDKAMLTEEAEIGDLTLIIDQRVKQSVQQSKTGIEVVTEPSGGVINLAIPLTELLPKGKPDFILDHFVAIDLGEVGIGYSVFKVDGFKLVEHGSLPIRSIRNLMSAVDRHRKLRQPQQKFQASYNPLLSQLRQNAIGDTLGVVDGLMEQFNAFPIFESSVGNFERGANQLKIIYESVLKHYTFSNIDAHKGARKHHWCGGEKWTHPQLRVWELSEKGEKTGNDKQLNLFPGASVHPAGTSQTCSKCQRNPIKEVYGVLDTDSRFVFKANAKDEYELPSGSAICLYSPPKLTPKELKEARRRKLNRQPTVKLTDDFKGDEMLKVIRRCLRFKQQSSRSKDTSQSSYRCLYSDCGHSMHADENAAINIGLKWVREKLVT
jgi:hypothetical protein